MKERILKLEKQVKKYKRLFVVAFVLWILFYLSGFFTGWWVVRGNLSSFPSVSASTRALVLAPHPDDEVLMAGGLIQRILAKGGQVKVVFLTSGDASRTTVVWDDKEIDFHPAEMIALGETRIKEAMEATQALGLTAADVYFLGFPDQGLTKLLQKNFTAVDGKYVSSATKVDHVPYGQAYHPGEAYLGENLLSDVRSIIASSRSNLILVGHPRDGHPDHRASFLLMEKLKSELTEKSVLLTSLVHFRGFPNPGGYLFPPRKLFGSDWVNLVLTSQETALNQKAIKLHVSQDEKPEDRLLFERLTAKNQIFEAESSF